MNKMQLSGIFLAAVMLCGSIPIGFSEPLRVQLEQGIETENIQCDNPSHVLVERTNGKLACVSERTAERMGWEIIKFMESEISSTQLNESPNDQQHETFLDYGTATASFSNNAITAGISSFCSGWPKNFAVEFPNTVPIGEDFDIKIHYSYIIYDDEDILESKQTGEKLVPEDAEDQLENARSGCFDTFVYFGLNEKISLVTPHITEESNFYASTDRTTNYYHIEYPFNNTEEQIQTVTMRFDSLPDRYDENMLIGTQGPKIRINHFVDDNGTLFLYTPSTNNVNVVFSVVSPFAAMTDDQKAASNFYTEEIPLPEKTLCEQFVCDENGVPVGSTKETLPPMESFAEFLKANVAPEDLVAWLENEEKLTPEYIEKLLETYFPDLVIVSETQNEILNSTHFWLPMLNWVSGIDIVHVEYEDSVCGNKICEGKIKEIRSMSTSWIPSDSGEYHIVVFAWEEIDHPTSFGPPISKSIIVI